MSKIASPYKCDVCGTAKGEGNKWLLGFPVDAGMSLGHKIKPDGLIAIIGYAITDWRDIRADDEKLIVHHLCSEKCAFTKQAEYIRRT